MKRLSFHEYGLLMAINASMRSPDPHTVVGGAAFRADNKRFLSAGYNGLGPNMEFPEEFYTNRQLKADLVVHCEQNLKLQDPEVDKIVFLSLSPCFSCAKLLSSPLNKVIEVVYLKHYERDSEMKFKMIFDFYNIKYRIAEQQEVQNIYNWQKKGLTDLENLIASNQCET